MSTKWMKLVLAAALFPLMFGCGQIVQESVAPIDSGKTSMAGYAKPGIVVLPLADYSTGKRPDYSLRRQLKIYEALNYHLAGYGFYVPMEEDVVQALVNMGIIKVVKAPSSVHKRSYQAFKAEIGTGWSDDMQQAIDKVIEANQSLDDGSEKLEVTKIGLEPYHIKEIGRRFGADYVLRGRIVEYEVRQDKTLNPFRQGMLPFFFNTTSQTLFGFPQSEKYDLWHDMAVGGALGAMLGSSANHPFNEPERKTRISGHPRFGSVTTSTSGGYDKAEAYNALFWGGAVAGSAYLASKGGQVNQAVVQISLALQDAHTGAIVWANRVEKVVQPESVWADPSVRKHMDTAVESAVKSLTDDMYKRLASIEREKACLAAAGAGVSGPTASQPPAIIEDMEPASEGAGMEKPEQWGS